MWVLMIVLSLIFFHNFDRGFSVIRSSKAHNIIAHDDFEEIVLKLQQVVSIMGYCHSPFGLGPNFLLWPQ